MKLLRDIQRFTMSYGDIDEKIYDALGIVEGQIGIYLS